MMPEQVPMYLFYVNDEVTLRTPNIYANDLALLIEEALASWGERDEASMSRPVGFGRWSIKQVFGHLCDSAGNNLQRVVRLAAQDQLVFPRYEQDTWVRVQRYDARSFLEVLDLFRVLHLHLAHVIRGLDSTQFENEWLDGDSPKSLRYIIEDYLGHLQHHLEALSPPSKR